MGLFRAQLAHMRAGSRDVAFGTNVRQLSSVQGADTNFTVTYTSTTATTQTINPFTNISNQAADNRQNMGWALNQNEASADGVGSKSTELRLIPGGIWSFQFSYTGSTPALLASYTVLVEFSVYRVAPNGGARTLLFTAATGAVQGTSGTGDCTSTQGDFLLLPGETLHVAVRVTSAATSSILGGTTNTVLTFTFATAGTHFVAFPEPGMRTLYLDSSLAQGAGSSVRSNRAQITSPSFGSAVGSFGRSQQLFREFEAVGEAICEKERLIVIKTIAAVGTGVAIRAGNKITKDLIRATGAGVGYRSMAIRKDLRSALGSGTGDLAKAAIFVRDFLAQADGVPGIARVVIFVRNFEGVGTARIRPRIALDFDDLPDIEGGGQIVNVFRPMFLFDD